MCGINGIAGDVGGKQELLEKMNVSIRHRGPDGSGTSIRKEVGLGHVRLSILDTSSAGHQPMFYSKDFGACSEKHNSGHIETSDISLVYNGEIYNYKEIKKELLTLGYNFSTHCDTEVILASYLEWGEQCVTRFNGMWAFALHDIKKDILFCSRDRLGKKPFYYYYHDNTFIFSSEIKSILETGVPRKFNSDNLETFLLFHYTPNQQTLVKNIFKLPAASNLILSKKKLSIIPYWDIQDDTVQFTNFEKTKEEINSLLHDAIKIRTENSDVPVGTFLSGGLDSSLVSAIFKQYYTGKDFHTFNVIWEDDIPNEGTYAEIVSKHIKSTHHRLKVTGKDVFRNLELLQRHYCDPISEAGFIPNFFLSKYAKKYVKVVLTGDGADEAFAGYEYYVFLQKLWGIGSIPGVKFCSKILGKILPSSKFQKGFELLSYANSKNFHNFFGLTISNFSQKEMQLLLIDKQNINVGFESIRKTIKGFRSFLNQLQYTDQKILLQHCYNLKPDNALMGNSVEGRSPMQDYRLVDTAFHLPDNFKIKNGKEKYILTEIGKKYLPKEIFLRKKQGYGVPIYEWINAELKPLVELYLTNSVLVKHGYFNQKQINFYLKHKKNKYFSTRIWTLFSLELYIKVYKLDIE